MMKKTLSLLVVMSAIICASADSLCCMQHKESSSSSVINYAQAKIDFLRDVVVCVSARAGRVIFDRKNGNEISVELYNDLQSNSIVGHLFPKIDPPKSGFSPSSLFSSFAHKRGGSDDGEKLSAEIKGNILYGIEEHRIAVEDLFFAFSNALRRAKEAHPKGEIPSNEFAALRKRSESFNFNQLFVDTVGSLRLNIVRLVDYLNMYTNRSSVLPSGSSSSAPFRLSPNSSSPVLSSSSSSPTLSSSSSSPVPSSSSLSSIPSPNSSSPVPSSSQLYF